MDDPSNRMIAKQQSMAQIKSVLTNLKNSLHDICHLYIGLGY
jgi:hypothetical protein